MEFLRKAKGFILLARPKNLLIIGLNQFILYHFLITQFSTNVTLDYKLFFLLSFTTILTASTGYVINDIMDQKGDAVNKPRLTYIPDPVSHKSAKVFYFLLATLSLLISLFLDFYLNNLLITLVSASIIALLYVYSRYLKRSVFIGNILISILVVAVTGILFFVERKAIFEFSETFHIEIILQIFYGYMIFSFLINLVREIIKDMEDVEGDKLMGYKTFPIQYGIENAKKTCVSLCMVTIVIILVWLHLQNNVKDFRFIIFLLLLVIAPLILIIQILVKPTQKRDFSRISSILKWIMLAGIASIVLISQNLQEYIQRG